MAPQAADLAPGDVWAAGLDWDDIVLHRGASGWGVMLSSHFGRPQAKRR